ncbi:unnamed protein product [Schistosoma margrebowiei]|uniref:Uncharacterized protein n=1 Tax=Schistosoma margrebowiei TaxID=48269 RepID=A0A183LMU1_9TREM|nr:unnamed protein product [Schistosoma margrebowiei]
MRHNSLKFQVRYVFLVKQDRHFKAKPLKISILSLINKYNLNMQMISTSISEFSEIQEVSLPTTSLWIPDVGVMNGKASTDFDFSAGVRGRVTVSNDGSVTWLHGAVLDVTCPLDVSFFPFDYQTCFLILVPWQSGEQQLLLQPFTHGSAVDNSYLPNSNVSEWEIQSVHFVRKKYRSDMNVTYQYVSIAIHLKRQPLYFIVLVLVPFSMLSALACLIFTLDDTGDRLSVALSLVLSMTMYVVIVSTNAPRSMRTLPVLGKSEFLTIYTFYF